MSLGLERNEVLVERWIVEKRVGMLYSDEGVPMLFGRKEFRLRNLLWR